MLSVARNMIQWHKLHSQARLLDCRHATWKPQTNSQTSLCARFFSRKQCYQVALLWCCRPYCVWLIVDLSSLLAHCRWRLSWLKTLRDAKNVFSVRIAQTTLHVSQFLIPSSNCCYFISYNMYVQTKDCLLCICWTDEWSSALASRVEDNSCMCSLVTKKIVWKIIWKYMYWAKPGLGEYKGGSLLNAEWLTVIAGPLRWVEVTSK